MASQLPYLPPFDRFKKDVSAIATGAAQDVQAAQSAAAKAGTVVRAGLATVPAAVRAVNDTVAVPAQAATDQIGPFVRAVTGTPQVRPATAGLPVAQPPPATQAPVVSGGTPDAARDARTQQMMNETQQADAARTAAPAAGPVRYLPAIYSSNAVSAGINAQSRYAAQQRAAVLDAADAAAASGNPDNATYRYAAALHALPTLSGMNSFAHTQAQLSADLAGTAERERSSARMAETSIFNTQTQGEGLRRHAQPVIIEHIPNPDPNTRMMQPTIPVPGIGVYDQQTGKIKVYRMNGEEYKAPTASAPTVGAKVSQKDGAYPLAGGKTAVVKGGVITEIK